MSDSLREILDVGVFWEFRDILLRGLAVNFLVFFGAAAVALGVGLAAALMRVSRFRALRIVGTVHVEIFRNAPDYVMIVWVHFVLPLLIGTLLHTRFELNPYASGILALGLVYSGYFAETFRTGIEAVPAGHLEAGRSLGMGEGLMLWRLVLPQVVRRMLTQPFSIAFWSLGFPLAAFAALTLRLAQQDSAAQLPALVALALASLVVLVLGIATWKGWREGSLLQPEPVAVMAVADSAPPPRAQ
jgi:His/Glu/Gln/Arg/opine family amino acid ABC transporter permease subunit